MSEVSSEEELKEMMSVTATRPYRYEQGDVVFGTRSFNHNPDSGSGWASTGKTYTDEQRARERFEDDHPLIDEAVHDRVLYKATVAVADSPNSRDSFMIAPDEETEMVLTDIEILERKLPE